MYPEEVAARILADVEEKKQSLRKTANSFFEKNQKISFMKPVVRVITLGVLKNYIFLDYLLETIGGIELRRFRGFKKWLLRVIAYSLTIGRKEARVSRVKKIIEKTGVAPSILELKDVDYEGIRKYLVRTGKLDIAYSFPKWLLNYVKRARVPGLERFLESLLKDPVTWIRVSTHKIKTRELAILLNDIGFYVKEDRDLDDCLEVVKGTRGSLAKTYLYEKGYYVIQDKASILVGHIIDPKGKVVLDVSAGAGLKTTHIIQLGARKVIAQDISERMLLNAIMLARRLGLRGRILFISTDSTEYISLKNLRDIDVVIVDPPCSGIGRFALQPELKLHLTKNKLKSLIRTQYRLLENIIKEASRGLKILYSTCTITVEENENIVKTFEREGYVEILNQKPFIGTRSFIDSRIQKLYPHLHRTQGFTISFMVVV